MRFLIDTNVLIPLEPTEAGHVEAGTERATLFARLVAEGRHQLLLHPESSRDIDRDRDQRRRTTRQLLARKYALLTHPPGCELIEHVIGSPSPESHDWVDHHLLAALFGDAIDYVVTDDGRMRRKAARVGLADRVLSIDDAIGVLETLSEVKPEPPPTVELRPMHSIDLRDPIFESLREDYDKFDDWFRRGAREGRQGWLVTLPSGRYAGLCLLKPDDDQYSLGGKVLKVSTFKVAAEHQGNRYGELLLKTLFDYIRANSYDRVWVSVFERHESLIALFEQFGFERRSSLSPLGELVYSKTLRPSSEELDAGSALEVHVKFGPPCVRVEAGRTFVVPIQPRYHRMLFPEYPERRPALFTLDPGPFGNALRKAYLCNSAISTIEPGATLLFYRSEDDRALTVVGVVDRVMRSQDVAELTRFVGQRTVYSESEIRRLASSPVLAMLFRQDRFLRPPASIRELASAGVARRAPQSIMTIRSEEATRWLRTTIDERS
jgi:L-amino acid N-acyltransferase YncA